MKNLFFALAFMLVGTFAFANNTNENTVVLNETEMVMSHATPEMVKVETTVQEDVCADIYDVYIDGDYAGTLIVIYDC